MSQRSAAAPTTIFVQVAAYRDPQLVPTVRDMLSKADSPSALSFGVCWQHGPDDDVASLGFVEAPPFLATLRLDPVPFAESRGLCWARSRTNALYRGEALTMQIDSHHRFVPHWDSLMLQDYAACLALSAKPILTTYLPPFDPDEYDKDGGSSSTTSREPTLMKQYRFHPGAKLLGSMPWYVPPDRRRSHREAGRAVVRARCLSGHFYLTAGSFVEDVPYDPDLYFGGEIEEVSMSIRAWTHGYDLFSPSGALDTIGWHEYTRKARPKHWDDHSNWTVLEKRSRERFDALCGRASSSDLGAFGVGGARTLAEYCAFAGVDFARCRIQRATLDVEDPPNDPDGAWVDRFDAEGEVDGGDKASATPAPIAGGGANTVVSDASSWRGTYRSCWSAEMIRKDMRSHGDKPPKMLALGLEDERGKSLVRADICGADVLSCATKDVRYDGRIGAPARFVLWPMFEGGAWGTRQEGRVTRIAAAAAEEPPSARDRRVDVSAVFEPAADESQRMAKEDVDAVVRMACADARSGVAGGQQAEGLKAMLRNLRERGINVEVEYVFSFGMAASPPPERK